MIQRFLRSLTTNGPSGWFMVSVKNNVQYLLVAAFVLVAILAIGKSAVAQNPTPPSLPGRTQGSGTHFALPNSPYLPVTLDSSVPVTLTLSSVPEVVDLTIGADAAAGSAQFTLSGFAANTLYYQYTDNGLNPVTVTTDANGSFTYTQDLTVSHHVWFRETPSTYYLYDNATGGDCTSFGSWDWSTKTCTLTQDIYQTIFNQANGITLDGNGFSSLYSDNYYAVYSFGYSDVTIKNLNVSGSTEGIWAIYGNNITVTNNTVSGGYYGILTYGGSNVSITDNTITGQYYYGIYNEDAYYYPGSGNITIANNTVSAGYYGIYTGNYYSAGNKTIVNNTLSNNGYGLWGYDYYSSSPTVIYNNNFLNNYYGQISFDNYNVTTSFNQAAPVGGNFFSDFNTPGQGCNNVNSDTFCDTPYGFYGGQDNLPWTTQNGWATPADVIAPTASPTRSPAANGAGWNNSDVTVTWNWTDNLGGSGIDNANCTTSSTSTGEGNPITLSATCKDLAGNTGNASYDVKVDKTLPTVSLVDGPADGASYYFGSVPAAPTCSASDALSGLNGSCAVSGYSALVGSHTVSAAANDNAGNQKSASASYAVLAWTTNGFFQPVDMGGVVNTVKNGSTVPLKFKVFAGSTELTSTSIVNQPLTATQSLCSGGTTDDIELLASGATSLRYDTTSGQFIYNWQTPKRAGYCYVVTVRLADGSSISANFKLK